MKKVLIILLSAAMLLLFAACGSVPVYNGVRYISTNSFVSGGRYSLCFENSAEKPLEFCVYGVFSDNERSIGLDESGKIKTAHIGSGQRENIEFVFRDTSCRTAPPDVVIIGEYK